MSHIDTVQTRCYLEGDLAALTDALEIFLSYRRITNSTEHHYRICFRDFRQFAERKGYPMHFLFDLTSDVINEYLTFLKERGFSPFTVKVRMRMIESFLRFAHKFWNIDRDLLRVCVSAEPVREYFHHDEVVRLLQVPDNASYTAVRNHAMVLLILDTGMRISEVKSLKEWHVDWENGYVWIPCRHLCGEDRKDVAPKYRWMRNVPISEPVIGALTELIRRTRLEYGEVQYVFVSNGQQMEEHSIRTTLRNYAKTCGLANSNHRMFRNTFVSSWVLSGGGVHHLSKLLGHSSVEFTQDTINIIGIDIRQIHRQYSPVAQLVV